MDTSAYYFDAWPVGYRTRRRHTGHRCMVPGQPEEVTLTAPAGLSWSPAPPGVRAGYVH